MMRDQVTREQVTRELLAISREFGERELVILGEGNSSARVGADTFIVKASGSSLRTLNAVELTECRFCPLLEALDEDELSEAQVDAILVRSQVNSTALRPSVETYFHALLLSLPGVNFVGHTHPVPVNQILCTAQAEDFADRRQCPDEVVCCGPRSLLIAYVDPGLLLAKRLRQELDAFQNRFGKLPRVILLGNHGVITIGASAEAVRVAMLMTVKAASICLGAKTIGSVCSMPEEEVDRIENRLDEAYRRKMLGI